jgi:hypothetical protein
MATLFALGVFGVSAASAATLTVCESGPPTCGFSHIQEAVNAASSGDTIRIAAGTFKLGPGELIIGTNLTLEGAGPERTFITREFVFASAPSVIISGVTVANGESIENRSGTLTLENSVVENNNFSEGGGMSNVLGGTLTVDNSVVRNNFSFDGAGIYTEHGTLTVDNSVLMENVAFVNGGGIFNEGGNVTVANTTISHNFTVENGGGSWTSGGTMTVNNSTVTGNSGVNGGGIFGVGPLGSLTLHHSTVSNNVARQGGGIDMLGTVMLTNTTIKENIAKEGGGIYNHELVTGNSDTITGNTGFFGGAGIFNAPGAKVELKHSNVQPG